MIAITSHRIVRSDLITHRTIPSQLLSCGASIHVSSGAYHWQSNLQVSLSPPGFLQTFPFRDWMCTFDDIVLSGKKGAKSITSLFESNMTTTLIDDLNLHRMDGVVWCGVVWCMNAIIELCLPLSHTPRRLVIVIVSGYFLVWWARQSMIRSIIALASIGDHGNTRRGANNANESKVSESRMQSYTVHGR